MGHMTLDISADLFELSRNPIAVISSGVKSILDIPRTLEYLETMGVSVSVYDDGQNDDGQNDTVKEGLYFPAFLSRKSSVKVSSVMKSPGEVARLILTRDQLGQSNGILVANPIDKKNGASPEVEDAIEEAVKEAERLNISGKDVTPFLLSRVERLTKGASLQANISLIQSNASLASKVALSLQHLKQQETHCSGHSSASTVSVTWNDDESQHQNDNVSRGHEFGGNDVHLDASHITRSTEITRREQTNKKASETGSLIQRISDDAATSSSHISVSSSQSLTERSLTKGQLLSSLNL